MMPHRRMPREEAPSRGAAGRDAGLPGTPPASARRQRVPTPRTTRRQLVADRLPRRTRDSRHVCGTLPGLRAGHTPPAKSRERRPARIPAILPCHALTMPYSFPASSLEKQSGWTAAERRARGARPHEGRKEAYPSQGLRMLDGQRLDGDAGDSGGVTMGSAGPGNERRPGGRTRRQGRGNSGSSPGGTARCWLDFRTDARRSAALPPWQTYRAPCFARGAHLLCQSTPAFGTAGQPRECLWQGNKGGIPAVNDAQPYTYLEDVRLLNNGLGVTDHLGRKVGFAHFLESARRRNPSGGS